MKTRWDDVYKENVIASIISLLEDEVINCTIGVMRNLQINLGRIERISPDEEITRHLLRLSSESIREALHKGELGITNAIIAKKNALLVGAGVPVPENHAIINPDDYSDYHW